MRPETAERAFLGHLATCLRTGGAEVVVPLLQRGQRWLREPAIYWRDGQGLHVACVVAYGHLPRISVNRNQPAVWKVPARVCAELLGVSLATWRRHHRGAGLAYSERSILELTVTPDELTPELSSWLAAALLAPALPDPGWTIIPPPPIQLEGAGIGPGYVSPPGRLPSYLWSQAAVSAWSSARCR